MKLMKATLRRLWHLTRVTSIVVGLAVMVGLVGGVASLALADKAGGGSTTTAVLKGVTNTATAVTTLINTGSGPALSLQSQSGNPPLSVNSEIRVDKLNADKVDGKDATELAGQPGPQGEQGPAGPTGPQGIVSTQTFAGRVGTLIPQSSEFAFVGPTVNVTTTDDNQKLVGSAVASLGISQGATQIDYGLCYQSSSTDAQVIPFFAGENYTTSQATGIHQPFPAAASLAPGIGTWKVGYCVRSPFGALDANDVVNGWVQLVNAG